MRIYPGGGIFEYVCVDYQITAAYFAQGGGNVVGDFRLSSRTETCGFALEPRWGHGGIFDQSRLLNEEDETLRRC